MTDPAFDYGFIQARHALDTILNDQDVNEAVTNSAHWAHIALQRLITEGVPAIHASGVIVATINTTLNAEIMQPPQPRGGSDQPT